MTFQDARASQRDQLYVYLTATHGTWLTDLVKANAQLFGMPPGTLALAGSHDAGMFLPRNQGLLEAIQAGALAALSIPLIGEFVGILVDGIGNIPQGIVSISGTQKDDIATQLALLTNIQWSQRESTLDSTTSLI